MEHIRRVLSFSAARNVPLTAILERYGILQHLRRSGRRLTSACPIHLGSNRRQFVVDPEKGVWCCFGDCQRSAIKGGAGIEFVRAMEGVSPREAADLIADWFSLTQAVRSRRSGMSGNRPSHSVFVVEEHKDRDPFWHQVGSMWPAKDGGFQLVLIPGIAVSGRIVCRPRTEKEDEADKNDKQKRKY